MEEHPPFAFFFNITLSSMIITATQLQNSGHAPIFIRKIVQNYFPRGNSTQGFEMLFENKEN
jgi:hypothetical protein